MEMLIERLCQAPGSSGMQCCMLPDIDLCRTSASCGNDKFVRTGMTAESSLICWRADPSPGDSCTQQRRDHDLVVHSLENL